MLHVPQILVCASAWKESLTPDCANRIITKAIQSAHPDWHVQMMPWSDGGDGFLEVLYAAESKQWVYEQVDSLGAIPDYRVSAQYLWSSQKKQLVIEGAEIHGLRRLPDGQRYPLQATSYGVGEALVKLVTRYKMINRIILTVGGSASTDGGLGFLQALGWQFFDMHGQLITHPIGGGDLCKIDRVIPAQNSGTLPPISLLTDVKTTFMDSPRIFGPQKGASDEGIEILTQGFEKMVQLLDPQQHATIIPGSGAAGGLPFGLLLGCSHVDILSGNDWLAGHLDLDSALNHADLIIIGEGCFDETSLLGKGTGFILEKAQSLKKPVIVFCGTTHFEQEQWPAVQILPFYPIEKALTPSILASTPTVLQQTVLARLSTIEQMLDKPLA